MPVPRIAIIGRPNAGKSSLLNMIAGERVSIVDPTPGVTRDRVSTVVDLEPPFGKGPKKPVEIIDTGGYGVYTAEGERYDDVGADLSTLRGDIERQIAMAVESADLVLLAVDAQQGVTPRDEEVASMLRRGRIGSAKGKAPARESPLQVRVVATKVDGPKWEAHAMELAGLGFGEPLMCSAKSNYFRRDFLDALYEILPEPEDRPPAPADLRAAIIGKRNAGKSSLVNALAGEPRVIVSEIAGTTRDAVDVRVELDGRSVVLIDTAGLRKKKSFSGQVEWYAFDRAQRAIARADVVLLVLDAGTEVSQVDEQLAMLAQKAYKPVIIVVNKWDVVRGRAGPTGKPITTDAYEQYLRNELRGLAFAPIAFASASEGLNVRELVGLAFELSEQARRRVTTGQLNRLVRKILATRGPATKLGTEVKLYYAAQVRTDPPTIALVVNRPELFTANYERFLLNRFREEFPYPEVPIRLVVRARRRDEPMHETEEPVEVKDARSVGWTDDELASLPDEPDAYFDEA